MKSTLAFVRSMRHMPATAKGMPADESIVMNEPIPVLAAAKAAAEFGEWKPARDLLIRTRENADWHMRGEFVSVFASYALADPTWLDAWDRADPGSPDAALVRAALAIGQAWQIRTGHRARDVTKEQFAAFHEVLVESTPLLATAAELNPDDPGPWRIAISHAMGLASPRNVFEEYVEQGRARDPYDLNLHTGAVQFLAAKWYGSHTEMFAFADEAAAGAPEGSMLRALPLYALNEYVINVSETTEEGPGEARIEEMITAGVKLSAAFPADDLAAAGFRNQLALALYRAGRHEECLEVFRQIGTRARSFPWAHHGDPLEVFLALRNGARAHVARSTPLLRRKGR